MDIRLWGPSQNSRKLPQNIVQFVICHLHNTWPWKRICCRYVSSRYIKQGPLYLTHATQKFYLLKAIQIFILSGSLLLRESPFHTVNCLKLFDFTLFFIYALKLLKAPLWHIFLLCFEKHMTCCRVCGSWVVHQLLNKTMHGQFFIEIWDPINEKGVSCEKQQEHFYLAGDWCV